MFEKILELIEKYPASSFTATKIPTVTLWDPRSVLSICSETPIPKRRSSWWVT